MKGRLVSAGGGAGAPVDSARPGPAVPTLGTEIRAMSGPVPTLLSD